MTPSLEQLAVFVAEARARFLQPGDRVALFMGKRVYRRWRRGRYRGTGFAEALHEARNIIVHIQLGATLDPRAVALLRIPKPQLPHFLEPAFVDVFPEPTEIRWSFRWSFR